MTDMDRMFSDDNVAENHYHDYDDLDVPDFLKKDKTVMDKKEYESLIKNSTTGAPVKAKPVKKKKINKGRAKKALVTLCCACMIFGAVAFQGAKNLIKGVSDSYEIYTASEQFNQEAIKDNTFIVNYEGQFDFHYDKIAEHIKTDEDVYLCYKAMINHYHFGESYANEVFKHVEGVESLDNFLETRNYKDKEEWIKVSNEQILLQNDIKEKQEKVSKMVEPHQDNNVKVADQATELGGK